MELDRVVLKLEFDSLDQQAEDDPEYTWPYDAVSQVVAKVGETFGGLPEELIEVIEWTDTTATITCDLLDGFMIDLIGFICFNLIPRKLELTVV